MMPFAVTEDAIALAKARRAYHARCREEWLSLQRGETDRDKARIYSSVAKDILKSERAATLVIEVLDGPAGRIKPPPAELEAAFRHEWGCVEMGMRPPA
jgi:hypothetical protein